VTAPTKGEVRIKGRIVSLLEVGTGFHGELTGRENVFLNGAILGMTKAEIRSRLNEIIDFSGVEQFIDTPVKRYSSGMYVRLAFAVAAHLEPEILIVDEVLAVGDAEFQKKCLGKMGEVAHGGRTVLFVSHNLSAIANVCQSAVLLHFGRLIFYGPVGQAISTYSGYVSETNDVNLIDYPRRDIGGTGFFQRLTLLDSDDRQVNHFAPLSDVILRINVRAFSTIRGARVGVAFINAKGERVFAIATYMSNSYLLIPEGEAAIRVRFRLPALFPGRYQLEIGAYDSIGQRIDEIHRAGTIEIEDVNFLKMTHPVVAGMGHIMVSSEWTVEENKACQRNSIPLVK
jgi:lipopolysaccharide transport system ATP-binding protein